MERFFEECDRKTEIAKRRLEETQEELTEDVADKVSIIGKVFIRSIFVVLGKHYTRV